MSNLGYAAILLAVALSAYGIFASVYGARAGRPEFIRSAESAVYGLCLVTGVASAVLIYLLVSRSFGIEYVYSYTSRELSWFYTVSAFWAGNAGSMLLWVLFLSIFGSITVYQNRNKNRELLPYVIAVMLTVSLFFSVLLAFTHGSNPFAAIGGGVVPANGKGLNPMLKNPGMIIHPLATYLGYVGFTIPFAFALAALITKRLGDFWIRSTRRWTILAWWFLTIGNIAGGWWAYVTLGWGGYWAWDPVENASFLPWLVGTAFLHSVMIQEKKDMLKVWNMVLIILTFTLTIFGTFLTRSGVLESVHSFGLSSIGPFFVGFIGFTLVVSFNLLLSRLDLLRSRNELDSFVSREASFLLNNLILVGMAFTVLWGVLFPILSEAVTGQKATVGPPFFNQVMVPITLVLLFVAGVCPLIAWRRATFANVRKSLIYPAAIAVAVGVALFVAGVRFDHPAALMAFTLEAFVIATIVLEFARGTWVRHQMSGENLLRAFGSLFWHNKRRSGGYIVHAGVVLLLFGVTGHYAYKQELEQTMAKGDIMTLGRYSLAYDGFASYDTNEKQVGTATFTVKENGTYIGTIQPVREYYFADDQKWTRIDRLSNLKRDVYLALLDYQDDGGKVMVKLNINPLVTWLWIGSFFMIAGGLVSLWPDKREKRRLAARYEKEARLHEA
jgi:cytochrome c-type biogenesis protein CcmF